MDRFYSLSRHISQFSFAGLGNASLSFHGRGTTEITRTFEFEKKYMEVE
jgi:hypothetical protein